MEGSNYWGYGYKTQHSYPRSQLITWRRPEVKFGRNVVRKTTKKNKLPRWGKKSAIKLILRLRSLIYKRIPNKNKQWCYLTHSWEGKEVHAFPKGICLKVNVRARLVFELDYYDSAVQCFHHYTTRTLQQPRVDYVIPLSYSVSEFELYDKAL